MRHRKSGKHFSRTSAHRAALMRNLAKSLIAHEEIRTTLPKAKELRRVVEPLVTFAREDNVARRRRVFSRLRDEAAVAKLFGELGPRYRERPGGYLRVIKAGNRPGDNAPAAVVQFVAQQSTTEVA